MAAKKLTTFNHFEVLARQEVRVSLFRNFRFEIHSSWIGTLIILAQGKDHIDRAYTEAEKKLRQENPFISDAATSDYYQSVKEYEEALLNKPINGDSSPPKKFK